MEFAKNELDAIFFMELSVLLAPFTSLFYSTIVRIIASTYRSLPNIGVDTILRTNNIRFLLF